MGVKGAGLRADGLHKRDMNGSPADHNGATERIRTGGGVSIANPGGLNKQFGNHLPEERGTPGTSPYAQTGGKSRRLINQE